MAAPNSQTAINEKKAATAEKNHLVKVSNIYCKKLDGSMLSIAIEQRLFVADYFNAKKINNIPKRTAVVGGQVNDSARNIIGLVKINRAALNLKRKVSENGRFIILHAPDGEYDFIFTRTG